MMRMVRIVPLPEGLAQTPFTVYESRALGIPPKRLRAQICPTAAASSICPPAGILRSSNGPGSSPLLLRGSAPHLAGSGLGTAAELSHCPGGPDHPHTPAEPRTEV